MSQAEDLLNSLNSTLRLTNESEEPHIIIDDDRIITVPEKLKRLAVQYDHDVETVTFDCPRYWDGLDMSQMAVYVNYLRADSFHSAYKAQNITVDTTDDTVMHFDWTISRNVSLEIGKIAFLVCIRKTDDSGNEVNHWNSELCKDCYISEGLEVDGEELKEIYPDIIEQWHDELLEMVDAGDFNGATFTPSVSEAGDLSWTNNKGLTNPATVNIHGVSPTIEVTDIQGGHRITLTDQNGEHSIDVLDTITDKTEAATKMLSEFVYIGEVEPTSTPVLWFDTSEGVQVSEYEDGTEVSY